MFCKELENLKKFTFLIAALLCLTANAPASAQSRQTIAVLPSLGDMDQQRLEHLTDKVREIATQTLPISDFALLKLDAIVKRVGEEELFRACKEGVCIGELARKADANYGARCDIFKSEDNSGFALKFELYNVDEDAIFYTFTEYDVKDFREMLALLDRRLPAAFTKILDAAKQPTQPGTPKPDTDKTFTLTIIKSPSDGGTVSRSPNYNIYKESVTVTVVASPNPGYTFAKWAGAAESEDNVITVTMNDNITLVAQFQQTNRSAKQPKEPKPPKPESKYRRLDKRISAEIGGGAALSSYTYTYLISEYTYYSDNTYHTHSGDNYHENGKVSVLGFLCGGYIILDFIYAEIFLDGRFGESYDVSYDYYDNSNAYGTIGLLLAKYPFTYGFIKASPILGLGLISDKSGDGLYIAGGRIDAGINKISYLRSEILLGLGEGPIEMSFKAGGGLDIGIGKRAYLRTELLYHLISTEEDHYYNDAPRESKSIRHSVDLKVGIGWKWGKW